MAGKRRYITFKVDEDLPDVATLRSQGRAREPLGVQCGRCMRFCGFCLVCTCTGFQALAPWMLPAIELGALLLLLLLLLLPYQPPGPYVFDYHSSLEDLVLLCGLRAAAICGTYAYGMRTYNLTPYLVASYVFGGAGLVYAGVKACLYSYPVTWLPPAATLATFFTFSWMHILAARYFVRLFRRRGQLGLLQGPLLPQSSRFRRSSSYGSLGAAAAGPAAAWLDEGGSDLPPELLAEPDSLFLDVDGLVVHYKQAWPSDTAHAAWLAAAGAGGTGGARQPNGSVRGESPPAAAAAAAGNELAQQQQQEEQQAGGPEISAAADPAAAAAPQQPQQQQQQQQQQHPAGTALPPGPGADTAIVLIHGFGGGVFAWRHVLGPLAAALGVRVVAFDRPGFGLTARPEVDAQQQQQQQRAGRGDFDSNTWQQQQQSVRQPLLPTHQEGHQQQEQQQPPPQQRRHQRQHPPPPPAADPYTLQSQALLTLRFCRLLGLTRVLLVGHADGCLVAVHAAALSAKLQHQQQQQQQQQRQAGGSSSSSREAGGARRPGGLSGGQLAIPPLQSEASIDLGWMGSLGRDPTPRMVARTAQAVQQAASATGGGPADSADGSRPSSASQAASAAGSPGLTLPAGWQAQHDPQQQQQQQQAGLAELSEAAVFEALSEGADAGGTGTTAPLVNRLLDDVIRDSEHGGGGEAASMASSISFQSLLLLQSSGGGSASQQHLADLAESGPSEGGGGGDANTGALDAQGGGPKAAAAAACSVVLKPPLQQLPMSSSSGPWDGLGASAQPRFAPGPPATTSSGSGSPSNGGRLPPVPPGARAGTSGSGSSGSGSRALAASVGGVRVVGLALLHPNLSGHQVPGFTRLLAGSSLGRSMLRPLLRSEVGVVTNRRAWHNPELLTREVLALYKRPLRVQGWDAALLATSRAASTLSQKQVVGQFAAVRHLPVLLVTGEHDRIATPGKVAGIEALLPRSRRAVVPACGHLSHEEAPEQLLALLVPFCSRRLLGTAAPAAVVPGGSPRRHASGAREGSQSPTRLGRS